MATLASYTLGGITGGDYAVTFTFDDKSTSRQIINWGPLADDPPDMKGGQTAAQKLDTLARAYAVAFQEGLALEAQEAAAAQALAALVNQPQMVSQDAEG